MPPFPWPSSVTLREVGLRDGLQSIARVLPTAQKLAWIRGAWEAGLREMLKELPHAPQDAPVA